MSQQFVREIIAAVPQTGAFQLGTFKLKHHETRPDAPLSPFYINLRRLRSAELLSKAATVLAELAEGLSYDYFSDVPTAATPYVSIMSVRVWVPMVSTRREPKGYGADEEIDGVYEPGKVALLVDDIITEATSKLIAIEKLERHGLKVTDAIVLLDRQQGGGEQLAAADVTLRSAFTADDLFEYMKSAGSISHEALELCEKYRAGALQAGWEKDVKEGWDRVI